MRHSPPVWASQLPPLKDELALGFLDLIEVRFVDAFLRHGVSWRTLRQAEARGRQLFDTTHPFATRNFKTDGRGVFAELRGESAGRAVLDLASDQLLFAQVVSPYLLGLEYEKEAAVRWWPLGPRKAVVIDPARSFGQPVVAKEGVPTSILAGAVEVEGSEQAVARAYKVSLRSVRHAVEFEQKLAA